MASPEAFAVLDAGTGRVLEAKRADSRALPGSTVKPFLPVRGVYPCHGALRIGGHRLDCTHLPVSMPLDPVQALALSCNCYFSQAILAVPPEQARQALRDFEPELATTVEQRQLQALGHWGVSATPLRLVRAYRALWQRDPSRISGGKTGTTAQAAWYAGWAPVDQPRIFVAVMTGGRGATDAQPAAQELIAKWLR